MDEDFALADNGVLAHRIDGCGLLTAAAFAFFSSGFAVETADFADGFLPRLSRSIFPNGVYFC